MGWSAPQYVRWLASAGLFLSFVGISACKFDNTQRGEFDPPKTTRRLDVTGLADIARGGCIQYTVSIQTVDLQASTPLATDIGLELSGKGSGEFYSDSSCSTVVSEIEIAAGATSAEFYFKDATEEALIFLVEDSAGRLASKTLPVTVKPPGSPTVNDGTTYDFGVHVLTTTDEVTFLVRNNGGVDATSVTGTLAAPFSYKDGFFPGTGGTCGGTLEASATCQVVVVFAPTVSNTYSRSLTVNFHNGVTTTSSTMTLQGRGITPASLSISDGATYDYNKNTIGTVAEKTFTVTNSEEATATSLGVGTPALAAPYAYKGGTYPGTGGTCGTSLNGSYVGGTTTCTIVVTFTPTVSGTRSDTIRLSYHNGAASASATRGVTGIGLTVGLLTITDGGSNGFGSKTVGTVSENTWTVTNSGESNVTALTTGLPALAAPFAYKGGSYPGTGGTCSTDLNGTDAGGTLSCTLVVTFTPAASGLASDTIRLSYHNGAATTTSNRAITGTGLTPAVLTISDSPSYHFGSVEVNATEDKSFTVTQSGQSVASSVSGAALAAPYGYKDGSYPGTGGTCGASIAVGGTCTIVVTYAPTADGNTTGTLTVNYNDGAANQSASRSLAGSTPGQLDLTFNTTGKTTKAIGAGNDFGRGVAVQSDGKVVVAGYYMNGATRELAVTRFTSAGAVDTAFGTSGVASTSVGEGDAYAYAVAIDSAGKIVVAGSAIVSGDLVFAVVRWSSTGTLDGTFGTGGKVTTAVGAEADEAFAVTIGTGNVPIVAGRSMSGGSNDFAVVKYTSTGVVDWQAVESLVAGNDTAYGVDEDASGNVYAVGEAAVGAQSDTGFLGLDSDGALIPGFNGGKFTVAVDATRDDVAYAAVAQADGMVVAVGAARNATNEDFFVARVETDGTLDGAFGTGGVTVTTIGAGDEEATGVGIQADGKIVVGGYSHNGTDNDFAVVRYTSAGAIDTTFNSTGKVTTAIGSAEDTGYAVSLDSTNSLIVVAGVSNNGSDQDFAAARYYQ